MVCLSLYIFSFIVYLRLWSVVFRLVYAWVDHGHFLGHQLDGLPHLVTNTADILGRKFEAYVVLFNMGIQLDGVGQVNSLEMGFTGILGCGLSNNFTKMD